METRRLSALASRAKATEGYSHQAAHEGAEVVRVLVADDHPIFRHGLRMSLHAEPDFRVVGEAADPAEAVNLVRKLKPDILLLGLVNPMAFGMEALRELTNCSTLVRTILLSVAIEEEELVEALRLGVRGFIRRDAAPQVVIKSIRTVMAGQYWVGRDSVPNLVQYIQRLAAGPVEKTRQKTFGLTPRELEIVSAIIAGSTNKAIAQQFSLSEDTVKHHLTHIFDKLGVSSRLELAVLAISHGLDVTRNP